MDMGAFIIESSRSVCATSCSAWLGCDGHGQGDALGRSCSQNMTPILVHKKEKKAKALARP